MVIQTQTFKKTIKQKSTKIIKESVLYEDFEKKIWGTVSTDKRIMTFVDVLWGFEVTGGSDQFEPLTVIGVKRSGLAKRAGIRVGDIITKINRTPAEKLTLLQAQLLIRDSGKYVKIYVRGDDNEEDDDQFTVDFWFTPPSQADRDLKDWEARRRKRSPGRWSGVFPWNDRNKPIYKESNCFLVESEYEIHHHHHHEERTTTTTTTTTTAATSSMQEVVNEELTDTIPAVDEDKGR